MAILQVEIDEATMAFLKDEVASGRFRSEAEVLIEGAAALQDQRFDEDRYVREVVVPRYDRMRADPSRGFTIEQVEEHLRAKRERQGRA